MFRTTKIPSKTGRVNNLQQISYQHSLVKQRRAIETLEHHLPQPIKSNNKQLLCLLKSKRSPSLVNLNLNTLKKMLTRRTQQQLVRSLNLKCLFLKQPLQSRKKLRNHQRKN